jgi:hypothetical protein
LTGSIFLGDKKREAFMRKLYVMYVLLGSINYWGNRHELRRSEKDLNANCVLKGKLQQ